MFVSVVGELDCFFGFSSLLYRQPSLSSRGKIESSLIVYSGIWYHFEHWSISLVLSFVAAVFGLFGLGVDVRESGWKLSDFIKIEIIDDDESDLE